MSCVCLQQQNILILIAAELKRMLKMENKELMSVFGIIESVFREQIFGF